MSFFAKEKYNFQNSRNEILLIADHKHVNISNLLNWIWTNDCTKMMIHTQIACCVHSI